MAELLDYLKRARESGASDLYIVAGCPVSAKSGGTISPLDGNKLLPPRTQALVTGLYELAERSMGEYTRLCRDEFSFAVPGLARFRVNAYRQRGSMAAVVRIVAFDIPDWEALHIPETVMDLAGLKRGLVLFAGGSGSGRSTTQACVVQQINRTRSCHIITLEDPIEFLYRDEQSVISQLEIGADAEDMLTALRCCLRQSPDVVMLGELSGLDTLSTALAAAEGGSLILASVQGKGAVRTVTRLLEQFPEGRREQARAQLSHVLRAVVSQQLVPDKDGALIPAFEQLTVNRFVSGMLRDGQEEELAAAVASGKGEGLVTMDQSLLSLYRAGRITLETALSFADNPEQMRRRCG